MHAKVEILRTNGTREEYDLIKRNLLRQIHKLIGAECCDTVSLPDGRVMIVDDNGWETEMVNHGNGHFEAIPIKAKKPVNAEATKLYLARCRPGTTHQIVGDVAIATDKDFA